MGSCVCKNNSCYKRQPQTEPDNGGKSSISENPSNRAIEIALHGLQSIQHKQEALFHGFLRIEVLTQLKHSWIPDDVVKLCHNFYEIDITHLLSETKDVEQKIFESTQSIIDDYQDYFIGLELCKLIMDSNDKYF